MKRLYSASDLGDVKLLPDDEIAALQEAREAVAKLIQAGED